MIVNQLKDALPRSLKREVEWFLTNVWDSFRYWFFRGSIKRRALRHIVFVCKGNICRSAFAEHYMQLVLSGGKSKIESCGLDVDQGGLSPFEAIQVGKEFGVDLSVNHSKPVTACNLQNADLIVAMEYWQYLRLRVMFPDGQNNIQLLREFAPWPDRLMCNIYDPFGLGDREFRHCFRKMKKALDGLNHYLSKVND